MNLSSQKQSVTEKFIWNIANFNRLAARPGKPFKSSIIHHRYARKAWRFFLYASGKYNQNCVAVYFTKAYLLLDPVLYNCSLSIGEAKGNLVKSFDFQSVDFAVSSIGENCFRIDSIDKLRKGSLKVECQVTEVAPKICLRSRVADFENLSADLTVLFKNPIFYDLIVNIQQYRFFLHTCVLYARARRLSHLFGYESFRQMPKVIRMNHISPFTFDQLMIYLYSGKLEGLNVTLDLFMCSDKLKLQSVKQLVYEKVQEHCTHTEIAIQTLEITWNLKEIQFREKGTIPFVQIFHTTCCISYLAVRMGISVQSDGEKFIDISFKISLDIFYKPVSLLCLMTLFIDGKACAYKKDKFSIEPDEEWHFPPFIKLGDIFERGKDSSQDIYLTAEVSLADGCPTYNHLHTKTRLFTKETSIFPERLGSDMRRLLASNVVSRFKKHDIYLKSVDNRCIPAHKALLFARWPAIRGYLMNNKEADLYLPLNLHSKEIKMLLDYIYSGSLKTFNNDSAAKLLQANTQMECPYYLVKKCENLLYGKVG